MITKVTGDVADKEQVWGSVCSNADSNADEMLLWYRGLSAVTN